MQTAAASHAEQRKASHQSSGSPKLGKVAAGSTPWWLRLCIANTHRASCMPQTLEIPSTSCVESQCAKAACCWLRLCIANTHRASCLRKHLRFPPPRAWNRNALELHAAGSGCLHAQVWVLGNLGICAQLRYAACQMRRWHAVRLSACSWMLGGHKVLGALALPGAPIGLACPAPATLAPRWMAASRIPSVPAQARSSACCEPRRPRA